MEEKENLAEIYYSELKDGTKPGLILARFFWEYFSIEPNRKDIMIFNKLVKIYGREDVFFGLLELFTVDNLSLNNYFPLLRYLITKKLVGRTKGKHNEINLSDNLENIKKRLERKTKISGIKGPLED